MIKYQNLLLVGIIVLICGGGIFLLLASSSIPVYYVQEAKDHTQPESLIERKIQLVGIVKESNYTHFSIIEPEDETNLSLIIYINATNVERPLGFEIGKKVLVEGKLLSIGEKWIFKASMISTKCPSKYEG